MDRCLTLDEVQALAGGRLPDGVSREHAQGCASCSRLLSTVDLDASDEPTLFHSTTRFKLVGRLGAGGMGIVYEVEDAQLGARVALKALRHFSADRLLRLKNEFRALADLHHRNLITLHELIHDDGQWFFTMELLHGVDFLTHVRPNGTLDEDRLRSALDEIAAGLDALHAAGLVHCDIKPSNVLVTDDGRLLLLDFGLVSGAGTVEAFAGTPEFMAPEQARLGSVGPPADWYSVGVMLYQALTQQLPFDGSSQSILTRKQQHEPNPPSSHSVAVPALLDELCSALLRIDPSARPTSDEVRRRLQRTARHEDPTPPPFIGRAAELDLLLAALVRSRAAATALFVVGESGVGKSALVRRFADEATRAGALVLRGRCYERESVPYKAVDEIVDAVSRRLRLLSPEDVASLLPADAALLSETFPVLSTVIRATLPLEPSEPSQRRHRSFVALRQLLSAMANGQPLVLTIDDLQWTDSDSLALLDELMRAPSVLLVATTRPGSLPALAVTPATLAVSALSADDARALAAQLVTDDGNAEVIAREAAGHPMFIAELARQSRRQRHEPLTLDEALRRRVHELDDETRELLQLAALCGRPVLPWLLMQAAQQTPELGERHLASLRAWHFVRGVGERLEPYHDRLRAAALVDLDDARRASLHRRLAEALEARSVRDVEALFMHWRGAGEPSRAADYAVAAAQQAGAALAFERAAELYGEALALDGNRADGPRLRVQLAESLVEAGRQTEAANAFFAAERQHSGLVALDLRRRAAAQLLQGGNAVAGSTTLDELLATIGLARKSVPRALAELVVLRARLRLRGFDERKPDSTPPESLSRLRILSTAAEGLFASDLLNAVVFQTRHILLALDAGDAQQLARALASELVWMTMVNRPRGRRFAELKARAHELARRIDEPSTHARLSMAEGMAATMQGRWREGSETLVTTDRLLRDRCTGVVHELNLTRLFLVIGWHFRGQLGSASRAIDEWMREADRRGELFGSVAWRIGLTTGVRLAGGDVDGAARQLELGRQLSHRAPSPYAFANEVLARATLDLHADDRGTSWRRLLPEWRPLTAAHAFRQQWLRVFFWDLRGRAALAASIAADTPGLRRQCLEDARLSARRIEREHLAWADPLASMLRATLFALDGENGPAARLYDIAARGFDEAGMAMHQAIARRRQRDLGGGGDGGEDWFTGAAVDARLLDRLY